MTVATVIGVVAGRDSKKEAVKVAALMSFVSGVCLSFAGLISLVTNSTVIGQRPFSSAETSLALLSSLLAGTAISSWILAGLSVLVVLAINRQDDAAPRGPHPNEPGHRERQKQSHLRSR